MEIDRVNRRAGQPRKIEVPLRTRVKVGIPVHVHYVGTGDKIIVDRVILDED